MTQSSVLSTGTRRLKLRFKCVTADQRPLKLTGNISELGAWNLADAVEMHANPSPKGHYEWIAQAELPLGQTVEYKFVRQGGGGPQWESGANHRITVIPGLHTLDSDFRE